MTRFPNLSPRISVVGKGASIVSLPLNKDPSVIVQLKNTLGVCWEATFSSAIRNDAQRFSAVSD